VWRRDRGKKPHAERTVGASSRGSRSNGGLLLLLALLALDVAILALVLPGSNSVIYSRSIPTLLQDRSRFEYRTLRTGGVLVHQSLYRLKKGCEFRFRLASHSDDATALDVRYQPDLGYRWSARDCALPDTFCDAKGLDLSVSVEGRLERDAGGFYFLATQVMCKCPRKYDVVSRKSWPPCLPVPVRG
jgi:cytochrome c-type biogenesis protein CcmE